jgi:hypothetical protein
MFQVSDKFKFYISNIGEPYIYTHYWILHRHNIDKDDFYNGSSFQPNNSIQFYEENKNILLKRLNEFDVFNIPVEFKNRDHIEIVFHNHFEKPGMERMEFFFEYKSGMWRLSENDANHIEGYFDEILFGEIKND